MENNFLAHHGDKGKKWGVQNAETAARYARDRSGKKSSSGSFKEAVKAGVRTRVTNTVENAKTAALKRISGEAKREAKARGYDSVKEYQNARNKALYSHNPETVAKYASTLTDQELQNKLKRLNLEKQVADMVPPKTKSAGQQAVENFANNFAKSAGNDMGPVAAKFVSKKLGISTGQEEKSLEERYNEAYQMAFAKAAGTKAGTNYANKSPENPSSSSSTTGKSSKFFGGKKDKTNNSTKGTDTKTENKSNSSSSAPVLSSSSGSSAANQNSSAPVNITLNFGSSPVSKTSIEKGTKAIKKVIDDDVIDVKPVSASSEREAKKFLGKFKKK